jgi:hypothetical protein
MSIAAEPRADRRQHCVGTSLRILFVCGQNDGSPSTTQSSTSQGEWQAG